MGVLLEESQQFVKYASGSVFGPPALPHLMTIGDLPIGHCGRNIQDEPRQIQEVGMRDGSVSQQVLDMNCDRADLRRAIEGAHRIGVIPSLRNNTSSGIRWRDIRMIHTSQLT